jgi:hypothetical protein
VDIPERPVGRLERLGLLLDARCMTSLVELLLPEELWQRIQPLLPLLDELGAGGRIDLDRVSVDSFSLRAVKGGT